MSSKSEPSAVEFVEHLVAEAERVDASDIHLQTREGGADLAFRLDGVMTPLEPVPAQIAENVFGRVKYLARLKTYQESLPQDGRIDKASVNARHDIRVATYPTVTGEKIVLRLFNAAEVKDLAGLGLPAPALKELEGVLAQTSGLLLLTGPAGSGKTTTIYSCLSHLAKSGGRHIITVEDPAEQILPGIMQTEINDAQGLDYAKASRHLLRQDPQVLVVGEIRDEETARIAVRAALTGHLIISTLHAGSCKGVFQRLLALCDDPSAVASAAELVLNQRLLRRVCPGCSGKGCAECLNTGYHGRIPIVEWLRVTDAHRPHISKGELQSLAPSHALLDSARAALSFGLTTQAEITRVLGS